MVKKKKVSTSNNKEKKVSISKNQLIETLEALCYAHYVDTFIEFLKGKNKLIAYNICPRDLKIIIEDFEKYMLGQKFICDDQYIKEIYDYIQDGGDTDRISKHLTDFYYRKLW